MQSSFFLIPTTLLFGFGFVSRPYLTDKWILLSITCSIIWLTHSFINRTVWLPQLKRHHLLCCVGAVLLIIPGWLRSFEYLSSVQNMLCFALLVALFLQTDHSEKNWRLFAWFFAGLTVVVLSMGISGWPVRYTSSSTYGHPSIMAQVAGLASVLAGWLVLQKPTAGKAFTAHRLLALLLTGFSFYSVMQFGSRSVLLALCLIAGWQIFRVIPKRHHRWLATTLSGTFLLTAVVIGFLVDFQKNSLGNLQFRLDQWLVSLNIARHHFWGIGFDQYPWVEAKFRLLSGFGHGNKLTSNPHNEWLRVLVELGWPAAIVFLCSSVVLLWKSVKLYFQQKDSRTGLAIAILFLLFIEAVLHFPSFVAASMLVLAWIIAYLIRSIFPANPDIKTQSIARWLISLSAILLLNLAAIMAYAQFSQGRRAVEPGVTAQVCHYNPGFWLSCHLAAKRYRRRGQFTAAAELYQLVLARQPLHSFAMQGLIVSYDRLGQKERACALYQEYVWLFRTKGIPIKCDFERPKWRPEPLQAIETRIRALLID